MRRDILEILQSIHPEVDYDNETALMDGRIFDSFDVVNLVGELMDNFDVRITAENLVPDNFNSIDAIEHLIIKLMDE